MHSNRYYLINITSLAPKTKVTTNYLNMKYFNIIQVVLLSNLIKYKKFEIILIYFYASYFKHFYSIYLIVFTYIL